MQQGRAGEEWQQGCRCKVEHQCYRGRWFCYLFEWICPVQMSAICSDCKLLHVVVVVVECVAHCTLHSALNLSSRQLLDTRLMPAAWLIGFVPYETHHIISIAIIIIVIVVSVIVTKGKERILGPDTTQFGSTELTKHSHKLIPESRNQRNRNRKIVESKRN